MNDNTLIGIIVLLIGGHWASVIYRLHKVENENAAMRRDFTAAAIGAANAAVIAAQAVAAAAAATAAALEKRQ